MGITGTISFDKVHKRRKGKEYAPISEEQNIILGMTPEDLAVEATRESIAIQELKDARDKDEKILDLKNKIKEFVVELHNCPAVVKAKEDLAVALENNQTQEHLEAKEDLKALKGGYNSDIKERSKKYKFMMKTLRSHMKSGLLKSKVD